MEASDRESKESASDNYDLVVDCIRHAPASYTEEERRTALYEGELTPRGRELLAEKAGELAKNIDPQKEFIVIWASPKRRTQQSAELISQTLEAQGVTTFKKVITKDDLRDVFLTPELEEKREAESPNLSLMRFWETLEEGIEGSETPSQVHKRTINILTILAKITRNYHPLPDGKRLHFIVVAHEETVEGLLNETFGPQVRESGLGHAEVVRLGFDKKDAQNVGMEVSYPDFPPQKVNFNINQGLITHE